MAKAQASAAAPSRSGPEAITRFCSVFSNRPCVWYDKVFMEGIRRGLSWRNSGFATGIPLYVKSRTTEEVRAAAHQKCALREGKTAQRKAMANKQERPARWGLKATKT